MNELDSQLLAMSAQHEQEVAACDAIIEQLQSQIAMLNARADVFVERVEQVGTRLFKKKGEKKGGGDMKRKKKRDEREKKRRAKKMTKAP